ncbi:MAG: thiamine diphosphokinase [Anaerolineae bacterium]|nr:thiamine diphosphokinase [Anaerolineae bacterium]
MRALIFANGECVLPPYRLVHPGDLIIAANGGRRHAAALGLTPHIVIGDLDSLTPDDREALEAAGVEIISFPPRKDETDLELALGYAVRAGADQITILGAVGDRLDQTIANVTLLALPELEGVDVRIVNGSQTAFLIWDEAVIAGRPGDTVSLIPWGGDAFGISTEGLEWPLRNEPLYFGSARGVSNVLISEQARIRVSKGRLLCVVTHLEQVTSLHTRRSR